MRRLKHRAYFAADAPVDKMARSLACSRFTSGRSLGQLMRYKAIVLVSGLGLACIGGVTAYRAHIANESLALSAPLSRAALSAAERVPAAADQPPAQKWAAQRQTARSGYGAKVAEIVALLQLPQSRQQESAAMDLINLPGEAVGAVSDAAARADLPAGPKAVLQAVLPTLKKRDAKERRLAEERRRYLQRATVAFETYSTADARQGSGPHDTLALVYGSPLDATCPADELNDISERCDWLGNRGDPLLGDMQGHVRSLLGMDSRGDANSWYTQGIRNIAISAYPAEWKNALRARYLLAWQDGQMTGNVEIFGPATALLEDIDAFAASDLLSSRQRGDAAMAIMQARQASPPAPGAPQTVDRLADFNRMYPAIDKRLAGTIEPLLFKARFYYYYAWDARGEGWASQVTPQGWKLFGQRLALAAQALEKVNQQDPSDERAPILMIDVTRGLDNDRTNVETWYRRAMWADPDSYLACATKMYDLDPRWGGSFQEMLKFGRECRDGGNYRGRLPLILARAHELISMSQQDRPAYFRGPGVWEEVSTEYEKELAMYPVDKKLRTRYAILAAFTRHWAAANRQFKILGDFGWSNVTGLIGFNITYSGMKDAAEAHVDDADGMP